MQSEKFQSKLAEARKYSTKKLIVKAIEIDVNAIIGIDIDYNMFGNNLIGVIVNGTAVKIEKI